MKATALKRGVHKVIRWTSIAFLVFVAAVFLIGFYKQNGWTGIAFCVAFVAAVYGAFL